MLQRTVLSCSGPRLQGDVSPREDALEGRTTSRIAASPKVGEHISVLKVLWAQDL